MRSILVILAVISMMALAGAVDDPVSLSLGSLASQQNTKPTFGLNTPSLNSPSLFSSSLNTPSMFSSSLNTPSLFTSSLNTPSLFDFGLKNDLAGLDLTTEEEKEMSKLENMMTEAEKTLAKKEAQAEPAAAAVQVPVVSYTLPSMDAVKARAEEKAVIEAAEPIYVAPVAVECTPTTTNGTICVGGMCYGGKCRLTGYCAGECCHQTTGERLPNGFPCRNGNWKCIAGECSAMPACIGECCVGAVPKTDGAKCSLGVCQSGGCVAANVSCQTGACCNEVDGTMLPAGFPCHVNPCQAKSYCSGFSEFCPDAGRAEDGRVCPEGVCKMGVCVKAKLPAPESKTPVCTSGACCDTRTFTFKAKGTKCSNNPCSKGSVCLGNSEDCPPASAATRAADALPEGSKCPGGECKEGLCKPKPACEPGQCCRGNRVMANGTRCTDGACFLGKCTYNLLCKGTCCKGNTTEPVANGLPCAGGECVDGECRALPACLADCCEPGRTDKARAEGYPCQQASTKGMGMCVKGLCVRANVTCKAGSGACCNEYNGQVRPKGFPCRTAVCKESAACDGETPACAASTKNRPDGYPCNANGTCVAGQCVIPKPPEPECTDGPCCDMLRKKYMEAGVKCGVDPCLQMTYCTGKSEYCPITLHPMPDGTVCKVDAVEGNSTCVAGRCVKAPRKPMRPRCDTAEACCDLSKGRVRETGYVCAKPTTNPCLEVSLCDGFKPGCDMVKKADGVPCPAGACILGRCVVGVDPTDDDTTHEVHVHHDVAPGVDLVKVVTTRKSDGSQITKEFQIDAKEEARTQRRAQAAAAEENARLDETKANAKADSKVLPVAATASNIRVTHSTEQIVKSAAERTKALDHPGNPFRYNYLKTALDNSTEPQCLKGTCCNLATRRFQEYGQICGGKAPRNPCMVKICSGRDAACHRINVADGEACPQGLCFEGMCVKNCIGSCCGDKGKALPDGSRCDGGGACFNGICARNCTGDCCEPFQSFAKPDGAPCMTGKCLSGNCVAPPSTTTTTTATTTATTATTTATTAATSAATTATTTATSAVSSTVGAVASPFETVIPIGTTNTNAPGPAPARQGEDLEHMWAKMIAQEEKQKEQGRAARKTAREQEQAQKDAASANYTASVLQAATAASATTGTSSVSGALSTSAKTIIIVCSSAGFLVIVVIVVVVVVVSKKKKTEQIKKKKQEQETEYYYERF